MLVTLHQINRTGQTHTMKIRRLLHTLRHAGLTAAAAMLALPLAAQAQTPPPFPACTQDQAMFLSRLVAPGDASSIDLQQPFTATGSTTLVAASKPGTVAMGMGADGLIYAMGADSTNTAEVMNLYRYGADGRHLVAPVTGITKPPANFNAADIDLSTATAAYGGDLIVGYFRTDYSAPAFFSQLFRVNTTTGVATTINLSKPIPQNLAGDFVVSPDGKTVYGVSWDRANTNVPPEVVALYTGLKLPPPATWPMSIPWTVDLTTGAVTLGAPSTLGATVMATVGTQTVPVPMGIPYGAAARLPNGDLAFYFNGLDDAGLNLTNVTVTAPARIRTVTTGAHLAGTTAAWFNTVPGSASADGASCRLPVVAQLACTPATVVDSLPNNGSTCTVSLVQTLPNGTTLPYVVGTDFNVNLALSDAGFAAGTAASRYSSTCSSPITVKANASSAQCTITATPNDTPGDGDGTVTLSLAPDGTRYGISPTQNQAQVLVQNDDLPSVKVTCTPTPLFDSPSNVSTCTVALEQTLPNGQKAPYVTPTNLTTPLSLTNAGFAPGTAGDRYSSLCGPSISIEANASSATCTITATPNTVVGDGNGTVTLTALADAQQPARYTVPAATASAAVEIRDDDSAPLTPPTVAPVPTLHEAGLVALAALLGGWGMARQRRPQRSGRARQR